MIIMIIIIIFFLGYDMILWQVHDSMAKREKRTKTYEKFMDYGAM